MAIEKVDEAFGIVPLIKQLNEWQMLLVHHKKGHWGLPKGHAEGNEKPQQAAERELMEETNLEVKRYLFPEIFQEKYQFEEKGQTVFKTVHYFVAEVDGLGEPQLDEVIALKWFSLQDAPLAPTFLESRQLIQKVIQSLEVINA